MKKYTNKFIKGFTLVESLVAIGILSLSIAATFTAVQSSLKTSIAAKDQITAFYLAQEAMEYIKNVRDVNALHSLNGSATNWLASMSSVVGDPCYFGSTCTIDSPTLSAASSFSRCSGTFGTCPNLYQDSVTGLFTQTAGSNPVNTSFKREIQFTSSGSDSVFVTIRISWISGGVAKNFNVTGAVFNRQ
jgi:prepilin-type N-terminal cleavage/methylation domain-containing protein